MDSVGQTADTGRDDQAGVIEAEELITEQVRRTLTATAGRQVSRQPRAEGRSGSRAASGGLADGPSR
ncbi:hypothetical protein ACFVVH_31475, partial [Streptomyces albidoflavus]